MAGRIIELREQLDKSLHDTTKPWTAMLASAEEKTGLNRLYIFFATILVIALWLVFGYAAELVCNTVGILYPAYVSIKAIETKQKDDDTKWLTYWVVFAIFSLVEYFADTIVGFFPMYWLVKCIFLIWLMIPTELNGSLILYRKVIRPYFLKHRSSIDEGIEKLRDSATKLLEKSD